MSHSTQLIIPMPAYEDGVAAMNWSCKAFGFTEKTRWLEGQRWMFIQRQEEV